MKKFEVLFIPSNYGLIKVYIYGFNPIGGLGKVYAMVDDIVVSCKGTKRKKTIVQALVKLHECLMKQK